MSRIAPRSLAAILAAPVTIAVVVMAGLVSGLTGSGWRDWFCTGALAVPLIVFLFHVLRQARPQPQPQPHTQP